MSEDTYDINEQYWLTLPEEDLGQAMQERFDDYIEELERRGRLDDYRLAYRRYYGEDHAGTNTSNKVGFGGKQGEVSEMVVNHFRSILTSLMSLTTASRPSFEATATDDSADAMVEVDLAESIWEYELFQGAEVEVVDAVRRMLILQEGAIGVFWEAGEGEIIGQEEPTAVTDDAGVPVFDEETGEPKYEEGAPIHQGMLRVEALSPYDIARDMGTRHFKDCKWHMVKRRFNKWDIAAEYEEHRQEVLSQPSVEQEDIDRGLWKGDVDSIGRKFTDQIYVVELYALPTKALPAGRYARAVGDTVLESSDMLQYKRLPVVISAPESTIDVAVGSSSTRDLLAPQQAYDSVLSNLLSNNDTFGRGNILTADTHDLDVKDVTGGLQKVTYTPSPDAPPPGPMELPRLSEADMKFAEMLQQMMQVLSGVNDVVRGDPQSSLKAGVALALVSAMAIQQNSMLQKAFAYLLREMAIRIIETYRAFATTERVVEVTGSNETRTVKKFVGSDLNRIMSITVELGSPLMRTTAGKKELADAVTDPARNWPDEPITREQYITMIETGRLPQMFRPDKAEAVAIREECEALANGEPTQVLASDHHQSHIREHKALLDGRRRMELDPAVIKAIDLHIAEHISQWAELSITNPALLLATGQQPAPMPQMMGAAMEGGEPMGPDGPTPGGPPPEGPSMEPPGTAPPLAVGEDGAQGPQMPVNPMTGERVQLAGPAEIQG